MNLKRTLAVVAAITMLVAPLTGVFPILVKAADVLCSSRIGSTLVVDAHQRISNDPDSGTFGGDWALDNFDRHIQIWAEGDHYCAQADDNGTFTTFGGVNGKSPQSGAALSSVITGTMVGGTHGVLTGTINAGGWGNNPPAVDCSATPDACSSGLTGYWVHNYFPTGTYAYDNGWGWAYTAPSGEAWVNASAGNTGDIHSIYNSTTHTGYATLQDAIAAASTTTPETILVGTDVMTSSPITINKALTIDGTGHTLHAQFAGSGEPTNNSAITITHSNVTLKNLIEDGTGGTSFHGINIYESSGVNLDTVTASHNGKSGVVVNGSDVTATNLNTIANAWNGVNVDPGLHVTTPSVFTLTSGNLGEAVQIWSDGLNVSGPATVIVNASGYSMYKIGSAATQFFWTNRALTNGASITKNGVSNYYPTIGAALTAANDGDTINVGAGSYTENLTISKKVNLFGPNASVNPNTGTRGAEAILTGSILDNAEDTAIKGFKITNLAYGGATVKGVHVYGSDSLISNIAIQNNIFASIANSQAHGSYAIMVQGKVNNVNVSNNKIDGITSVGWAHAIEVTPTCSSTTVPHGITISGNSISSVTGANGDSWGFSADWCDSSNVTDASQITFQNNILLGVKVRNLDTRSELNAANNWWGTTSPTDIASKVGSSVKYTPWYINPGLTVLSNAQTGGQIIVSNGNFDFQKTTNSGEATLPDGATEIILNNNSALDLSNTKSSMAPTPVTLGSGTTTLTQSVVLQSGVQDTPVILTNSNFGGFSASIPDGTKIQGPAGWDGTITPPRSEAPTGTPPAGFILGGVIVSLGSPDATLVFDNPVTVVLQGVAGAVGYKSAHSGNWIQITNGCGGSYALPIPAAAPGECFISNGTDTKIVTYHFTTFGSLAIPRVNGGGGGINAGSGSGPVTTPVVTIPTPVINPVVVPAPSIGNNNSNGQVLGTSTRPDGTFVIDGKTVYLIKGGQKLAFTNYADFLSYGRVKLVRADDSDRAVPVAATASAKAGTVVWVKKEKAYYLINAAGEKQKYASYRAFIKSGHKLSQLRVINIDGYPTGAIIN